ERGYTPGNMGAAIFPLFPLSIRALHALGLPSVVAGLLIGNACFFAGLCFVYQLAALDVDEQTARRAVWLQALYPGSFFLLAPYPEPVYLALASGAFLAARRRRWALAGLAGAALSATRNLGVLIGPALLVELALQRRETPKTPLRQGLWLGLVPLGLGSF